MADIATIKSNIARMIDQGAPEEDIDAYVASEGVTPEQLRQRGAMAERQGRGASTLQGALVGFGDEVVAGGAAGMRTIYDPKTGQWFSGDYGEKYDEMLARERQGLEDFRSLHPRQAAGLEVAGGVATALVPAGAVVRGASLPGNIGRGIAAGGAMGGAQGFGSGEGGVDQRLSGAMEGAKWGTIGGGLAPVAGRVMGAAWNAFATTLANRGVDRQSIQKILGRLRDSGFSPQDAAQRLDELGPEAMLADVNSGMQVSLGATAIKDPGAAAMVSQRLGGRLDRAPQRVNQDLDAAFGPPRDPYTQRQASAAQRAAISPEYEEALTNAPQLPANMGEILQAQLTNPAAALGKRNFMLGIMNQVDDALMADTPELAARRLHDLRKNLDAQIVYDPRERFMLSSADKANQAALEEARAAIDDVLKNRVPGFQEADEAFAPITRQQAAYEKGRRALRDDISVGEHRADMAGYSRSERQMSNAGTRYDIDQRLDKPRQNAGLTADRILGGNAAQQKLEASIGRPGAERLRRGIDREETFTETSNLGDVRRNSRTMPLKEAAADMWGNGYGFGGDLGAAAMGGWMGGGWKGALGASAGVLAKKLGGAAGHAVSAKTGRTIRQVADDLTSTGAQRTRLIKALTKEAAALPVRARNSEAISRLATALLLGTSGQTGSAVREAAQAYGLVSQ